MTPPLRQPLGTTSRVIAGVLAVIWIVAGGIALVLGSLRGRWPTAALGLFGVLYGLIWARVAQTGRYVMWPFGRRR